ncbi:uncharacterized protein V6R79_015881 [Siganus canaliculatus]
MNDVSRRNRNKGNKENAEPTGGVKSFIKSDKISTVPFQLKSNKKEDTTVKNVPPKVKSKQAEMRSTSGVALKTLKTVQKEGGGAAADVKQRQTHTRAFLNEQAVKDKKISAEGPKLPAPVTSKSAPGMYKGKVVQSKIGSIWKSSVTVGGAEPKPGAPTLAAPKPDSQREGKIRSKSVTDLPAKRAQKPIQAKSMSTLSRPAQLSKPAAACRPAFASARPPTRTVPATLTSTTIRNTTTAFIKRSGAQNAQPKIPVTEKKVSKPAVSSTLSQYRFTVETAEERKAKLAEWLASKGKSLKRPAMTSAAPPKTKVSAKPATDLKPQPEPAMQCNPEPEPCLELHEPSSASAVDLCVNVQEAEMATHELTPEIMNTTLDLLEDSDTLSVEPQDRVDDIVINLCDALEAMDPPSKCYDALTPETDLCDEVEQEDSKPVDGCFKEELKNEVSEHVGQQPKVKQEKVEAEAGEETDDEEVESDDECVETTPQTEDASVVKYSVKTTPYLQSVKKTIEDDVRSASRRKSNIKDLKFLTPVRRSCRIQRKSSKLPEMLLDHDPCVSSLAELVTLDDDPNAYIYRKNTALLEGLPDQPRL